MHAITETEAKALMEWTSNFHSSPYLAHPEFPIRATLGWESGFVGDLATIARLAIRLFSQSAPLVHWTARPGMSSESRFDAQIRQSLFHDSTTKWPLIGRFEEDDRDLLSGYLAYRMAGLSDHTLMSPGADFAIGFTNDGVCLLYARDARSVLTMRNGFTAFADLIEEQPNKSPTPTTPSSARSRG